MSRVGVEAPQWSLPPAAVVVGRAERSLDDDIEAITTSRSAWSLVTSKSSGSLSSGRKPMTVHQMSETTKAMALFDDPSVCRGSCVWQLMRSRATIFENNEGSAATYELSRVVKKLDAFISHNWSVPRLQKLFCLLYYYNVFPALAAGFLAATIVMILIIFNIVPVFEPIELELIYVSPGRLSAAWCILSGHTTSMIVLFYWHEWRARLTGWYGPQVFLDKTCIHQSDQALQAAGILKLGAFLRESQNMVICYGEEYLRKLWTIYEVASFLTVSKGSNICVVPVHAPPILFAASQLWFVLCLINSLLILRALNPGDNAESTWLVVRSCWLLFTGVVEAAMMRIWNLEREKLQETVDQFHFEEAKCFVEGDRAVVRQNIAAFMKDANLVAQDGTDMDAVEAFDDLVRREVPRHIDVSLGRWSVPYFYFIAVNFCSIFDGLDHLAAGVLHKDPWEDCVKWFAFEVIALFSLTPNAVALCSAILYCFPGRRSKLAECVIVTIAALAMLAAGSAQNWALVVVLPSSTSFVLLSLGFSLVTAVLFRPMRLGCKNARATEGQKAGAIAPRASNVIAVPSDHSTSSTKSI